MRMPIACLLPALLGAQTAPLTKRKASRPSLQAEIEALKAGQDRLERELREIRELLKAQPARAEARTAPQPPPVVSVNVHGEPFRGSALAKVAILEYSDFDCTYCSRYAREIYPLLDHAYVQGGTVKYFFRDYPNPDHLNALFKARMARCAGEQDRFWEAHDRLFQDQKAFDTPAMEGFIRGLGLKEAPFRACLESDRYTEAIQRSAAQAAGLRLAGTPAFLIGLLSDDGSVLRVSKVFLGADSFEAFRTVLDELLAQQAK